MTVAIGRVAAGVGAGAKVAAAGRRKADVRADPGAQPAVKSKQQSTAEWKKAQGSLFVEGAGADDALQGALGDCYAISGFAALAQVNPKAIENAIKDNGDGTYTVRFFKQSLLGVVGRGQKPVYVTVDASLPMKNGRPLYAEARNPRELWPALLEKAWAKFDGSYSSIESGAPSTVWQALTGRRGVVSVNALKGHGLFTKMQRAFREGRPVAATTTLATAKNGESRSGLAKQHVYAVLGVSERGGQKYVTLRNPWGKTEPVGDNKNDGIFEMRFSDFKKHFGLTFIST